MDLNADGFSNAASSTGTITVQSIISQNRNGIYSISGPQTLIVGNTYTFNFSYFTATNGYDEMESALTFPTTNLQLISVFNSYAVGGTSDTIYTNQKIILLKPSTKKVPD